MTGTGTGSAEVGAISSGLAVRYKVGEKLEVLFSLVVMVVVVIAAGDLERNKRLLREGERGSLSWGVMLSLLLSLLWRRRRKRGTGTEKEGLGLELGDEERTEGSGCEWPRRCEDVAIAGRGPLDILRYGVRG